MARLRGRLIAAALGLGAACMAGPVLAAPSEACPAGRCGVIEGRARVAGQRQPIAEASVLVLPAPEGSRAGPSRPMTDPPPTDPPWSRATVADEDGRFSIDEVPRGLVRVLVIAPGFVGTERIVDVPADGTVRTDVFVDPDEDNAYRTVVRAESADPTEPRRHLLEREEIQTMPGSQGDPLRALQNLPGVARAPASLGLLVLRGAPPGQSAVFLGGHEMPRAFHVLSLSSVFAADVIDTLDFVPGNFDPAYGNATGGVVIVEPRAGRRDGFHGHAEVDLAAASALVEGPVGDGSFVVGVQRGYADAVVAGAGAVVEQVTGEQSGLLLPSYWDYQGLLDQPLPGGAKFSLRLFGAGDRLRGQGPADGTTPNAGFDFRTDFHRADLVFSQRRRRWKFLLTPSLRYELGRLMLSSNTLERRRNDAIVSVRAQATAVVTRSIDLTLGTDGEIDYFVTTDDAAVVDPTTGQPGPRIVTRESGLASTLGAFTVVDLHRGPVSARPGVRANAFSVLGRQAYSIDPRVNGRAEIGERFSLSAGVGRYSQARPVTDRDSVDLIDQTSGVGGGNAFLPPVFSRFDPEIEFAPQDTELTVRQAIQASAGGDVELGRGIGLGITGYFRDQDNAEPLVFDGRSVTFATRSRNIGLEVLLRKRLTNKLYGWIAYTLSYGELRFVQGSDAVRGERRPSDFDQRHNLVLLASYALPRGWRIGGRFRFVTGYPFTPIIGSIAVRGGFVPIQGNRNGDRLPPFHQLDIRVDKRWRLQRVEMTAYMDVQNVYNRQNPEAILYTADFRDEAGFVGIPIYPTLGFRIDY